MKNLKITKGEWHNNGLEVRAQSGLILANVYKHLEVNQPKEEAKAKAQLFADAGTTANKCGKLPSELLSERDEFAKLLVECWNIFIEKEIPLSVTTGTELENAINKITGK